MKDVFTCVVFLSTEIFIEVPLPVCFGKKLVHMQHFTCVMFWIIMIHNFFALYGKDVINACHNNKAECQLKQTMSNLITQNRH